MKKRYLNFTLVLLVLVPILFLSVLMYSCGQNNNSSGARGSASTNLKSTSLASAQAAASIATALGTAEGGNWLITPSLITGQALSIVFPTAGQIDEGVVVFGNNRPDLAPPLSALQPFNLSTGTTFEGVISAQDTYVGGNIQQILCLFGYFDVSFTHNSSTRIMRMVYGTTSIEGLGILERGDKLLYTSGGWKWYNLSAEAFTTTRPTSPAVVEVVRDFTDPVRPVLHYYFVAANISPSMELTSTQVLTQNLSFAVDFNLTNSVLFNSINSDSAFNALSDADLIKKFNMKQNVSSWGDTGITCTASVEVAP